MKRDSAESRRNPKISIIAPTFNAEGNISSFLASIASQTFKDFELLIVDGGSTDKTIDKIWLHGKGIGHISVISEPDLGVYDAMNKGMHLARGEWIYFLGTDDTFRSESTLEDISPELDDASDLIYGKSHNVAKGRVTYGQTSLSSLFLNNICHQSIFYRRSFAEWIGDYDLKYRICSDWDYNIRCFAASKNIKYIDKIICNYGGGGLSSNQEDWQFIKEKYKRITAHTKTGILSDIYTSCRHDFFLRAMSPKQFSFSERLGYLSLFAFHAVRQKLNISL